MREGARESERGSESERERERERVREGDRDNRLRAIGDRQPLKGVAGTRRSEETQLTDPGAFVPGVD